jgi:hypothetical protein
MTQKSRRKVLKGLAITMPAIWVTPVVESVILPAHAGTDMSGPEPCDHSVDETQQTNSLCDS